MKSQELYSLITLENFKAVLGIDDREDKISSFCLVTATYTIEQYCKRRLIKRQHNDYLSCNGDYIFPLKEYPLCRIYSVHAANEQRAKNGDVLFGSDTIVSRKLYYSIPDEGIYEDIPSSLVLRPPLSRSSERLMLRVKYAAGYSTGIGMEYDRKGVKPDLASACLELAAWNMGRYKARRIGMTGSVRGGGKDGEHFEMSMPMQVRQLLEPYKRKVI